MNRYKIRARATVQYYLIVEAESEGEAITKWEDTDESMYELDESSIDCMEYYDCQLMKEKTA